jgi:purine-binding chemotaxis protein CheW
VPSKSVLPTAKSTLVVLARGNRCALPLEHVVETMRPLPIERVTGAAPYLLGMSIIRGQPVPVVDLGALLSPGRTAAAAPSRFVTVRAGSRRVALAVEEVIGVRSLGSGTLHELPPLLSASTSNGVAELGVLDRELVVVLDASRLLPDETWAAVLQQEPGASLPRAP